ncbi:MAG: 2-dehydropantoate 2-reductase [Desulfocapsaceae bacterium]|nr:2-dehydropantoate 2-reductase [Desulfocapsaceae bacterium]
MKIVIVGGGAIGRLFGSFLGKGGHEVNLIDINQDIVGAMQGEGIGLMAQDEQDRDIIISVPVTALHNGSRVESCDLVLVVVKSQATLAAARSVAHLVTDTCPVLCIQTGLGNLESVQTVIPPQHILLGLTFMSGTALGDSRVRQGGIGTTYIGELNGNFTPRLEKIAAIFNDCGIVTRMAHRIMGRLWAKVIVNSAINPLSAILKVPNGCLTSREESIMLMKTLLDEGRRVAEAISIDLVCEDLYQLLLDTCRQSANNLSSMLQDILNDRTTEIDAQNGAICRYAELNGVAVPTHQAIVQLIKLLEKWKPGIEHV